MSTYHDKQAGYFINKGTLVILEGVKKYSDLNINDSLYIKKIIIPSTLEKIGSWELANFNKLREIIVSDKNPYMCSVGGILYDKNVTTLLFASPHIKRRNIAIPHTVTDISEFSFCISKNIHKLILHRSISRIDQNAFFGSVNIHSVYYDGDIEDWSRIDFKSVLSNPVSNANSVYFKNKKRDEFYLVDKLVFPKRKMKIKDYTFSGFKDVREIVMHENIKRIGARAFNHCRNVTVLNLPKFLQHIGKGAFMGMSALETVEVHNHIKKIDEDAFPCVSEISRVVFHGTLSDWISIDFCDLESTPMNKRSMPCKFYFEDEISGELTDIIDFRKIKSRVLPRVCFSNLCIGGPLNLEGSLVEKISSSAFWGVDNFTNIIIGENVTEIESFAFTSLSDESHHQNIYVHRGIEHINAWGFRGVTGTIFFEGNAEEWHGVYTGPLPVVLNCSRNAYDALLTM